jgi:hypothetical protein
MRKLTATVLALMLLGAAATAQEKKAFADKPALLTSVGQSADLEMVRVLMTRAKLDFRAASLAKASDITAADKTLVVVVGGSSKGLGAAGISAEAELDRAKALIAKAKANKMTIIAMHIGGEGRRGALSDAFINYAIPEADYVIIVADADKDGLFTKLTGSAKIPLVKTEKITGTREPLAAAFK